MKKVKLSWTDFKINVDQLFLDVFYFLRSERYYVHAFNGPFHFSVEFDIDSLEAQEFEATYKSKANKRAENTVKIEEESYYADTEGIYQARGFKLDVPSGVPGDWTEMDTSFDFNISLFSASWHSPMINDGDLVEFYVAPSTVVGVLTAPAAAGDTVISVSQTVMENIRRGYYIEISEGLTVEPNKIKVLSHDATAMTLTLKSGLVNSYNPATPSYILMTSKMIDDIWLSGGETVSLGKDTVGGSYIPANTPFRIKYQNNSTEAKSFKFIMEYKY